MAASAGPVLPIPRIASAPRAAVQVEDDAG
ncbi:MAG: hypothetical protein QOK40_2890, partial [Miltoncostaeaceae bacterium]|nr:hypothetical protein [Miltoncostaeaceae bacterium]